MIMTKNYFTDEQVKEALEKLGMRRPFSSHSLQHYKNLMNLAVEAAIGEEVAYQYEIPSEFDGWSMVELSRNKLIVPKDTTITQLYSVKELEN